MELRLSALPGQTGGISRRILALGGIAALLVALTVYDYTSGSGGGRSTASKPASVEKSPSAPSAAALSGQWREVAELRHFRDHADAIRQRYQTVAVPYAESVATFATLYGAGQSASEQAARAIRGLVPAEVEVKDVLMAESGAAERGGIVWLDATVSLSSGDSQAMSRALLTLGDAANGMVWKELSAGIDAERKRIQAKGRLAVLMLPQAE